MTFEDFYDRIIVYKHNVSRIVDDIDEMANELLSNKKITLTKNQYDFVMDVLLFWKTHLESGISGKQVVNIEKIINKFQDSERKNVK